jgi:uncharacterized protein with HEPN domain
MRRDPQAYLWDVRNAAEKIETFVRGRTLDDFRHDVLVQSAVERQLEIIGEALNQLAGAAPSLAGEIPDLRRLVGLRNILIHGYAVVDYELIWRAVHENLPALRTAVDRLMRPSPPPAG